MTSKPVRPKEARTKRDVSAKLAEGWFRVTKGGRKGALADACGVSDTKPIDAAIANRSLPQFHTALNSLLHDPTALDEVFALYGFRLVPVQSEAANDLEVIADMNGASSVWLHLLIDGIRCQRDTKKLAEVFRPLVVRMQGVIEEAEKAA